MKQPSLEDRLFINRILLLCLAYAFLALTASTVVEFGMKIAPCKLCKAQRLIMGILGTIGAVGYWTSFKQPFYRLAQLCLMASICLAAYHLAVQMGWFPDPCKVPNNVASLDDFKRVLRSPPPCSVSSWNLMKIPATGYTLMLSAAVTAASFQRIWLKSRNQRRV